MDKIYKIILMCLFTTNVFAVNIDDLLQDIEKKTDLSEKTKLANSGIAYIYTRDELERMQVKYLKDILKSTQPFGYRENRYGMSDPMYLGSAQPFMSSTIRVFIDNQEMTSGMYGSGLFMMGDIDIGFVDHIELYVTNPSFEFSTEPTILLVKLYSKKAIKDDGNKIELNTGSYGANRISGYTTSILDNDWAYFTYFSQNDDVRKKYYSHGTELSRDKKVSHIFGSLSKNNHNIIVEYIDSKKDGFISRSLDATPVKSELAGNYFHLGYDAKINNFSYLFSYEDMGTQSDFKDDNQTYKSVETKTSSQVYTAEIKYNLTSAYNKFIIGLKYRYKAFKYDKFQINYSDVPLTNFDNQQVSSLFVENQYSLAQNSILTTGISYMDVKNNDSVQQDNLLNYRIGHTYTTTQWINKVVFAHLEVAMEPYLVNSDNIYIVSGKKKSQTLDALTHHIIFEPNDNKYEFILNYSKAKGYLQPSMINKGLLDNIKNNVIVVGSEFRWTYKYNEYDKLITSFGYMNQTGLPIKHKLNNYRATIRNINTYDKFDIFNELLFHYDTLYKENTYDYSVGVKYHYSKDLTISVKGENLFNKARKFHYTRVTNINTLTQEEPLKISPIDKKIMFSLEYLF